MTEISNPDIKMLLLYAIESDPDKFPRSRVPGKTKNDEIQRSLEENGLLTCSRKGKALYLSANDATWHWVEAHLAEDIPWEGAPALRFLNVLRVRLARYMASREVRLSDVFADQPPPPPPPDPLQAVREAYLVLSSGKYDVRVRLADLRPKLNGMVRPQQDEILLSLQKEGWLGLMPNDDPQDRTSADEAASLVIGDRHRDLVFLHPRQKDE